MQRKGARQDLEACESDGHTRLTAGVRGESTIPIGQFSWGVVVSRFRLQLASFGCDDWQIGHSDRAD